MICCLGLSLLIFTKLNFHLGCSGVFTGLSDLRSIGKGCDCTCESEPSVDQMKTFDGNGNINDDPHKRVKRMQLFNNRPHPTAKDLKIIKASLDELKKRNLKRELVIKSCLEVLYDFIVIVILLKFTYDTCKKAAAEYVRHSESR